MDGRTFLIETVPVLDLADDLNALPLTASVRKPAGRNQMADIRSPSSARHFPPARKFAADTNQILLASLDLKKEPGVVLDYYTTISTDQTDFTFRGDTTYYLNGTVYLSGTNILEGGTVIKYARSAGELCIDYDTDARLNCLTASNRPVRTMPRSAVMSSRAQPFEPRICNSKVQMKRMSSVGS